MRGAAEIAGCFECMSEDAGDKLANAVADSGKDSFGCGAWLGIVLLVLAVLVVLFFWLIDPGEGHSKMDWRGRIDNIKKTTDGAMENVSDKLDVAGKVSQLRQKAKDAEKSSKVLTSADVFSEAQKTFSGDAVEEKVNKKKKEVEESWY